MAAASGNPGARVACRGGLPDGLAPGWVLHHPLVVGGDRVGTLSIPLRAPRRPEPRQSQIVARLLPTVSLVARAVGLAIEADHAREDVARERDLERSRSSATCMTASARCWPG